MIEFEINKIKWCVTITDDFADILKLKGTYRKGVCSYKDKTIYLSDKLTISDLSHIILHELCHAVIYMTQIKLDDNYTEEDLCEFVGKYYNIISDIYNIIYPELVKKFTIIQGTRKK